MEVLRKFIENHRPLTREPASLMWLISEITLRGKEIGLSIDQIMDLIATI